MDSFMLIASAGLRNVRYVDLFGFWLDDIVSSTVFLNPESVENSGWVRKHQGQASLLQCPQK